MAQGPRWYHEPWAVGVMGVLVPPVGFLLLWLSVQVSFRWKLAISVLVVAVAAGVGWLEYEDGVWSGAWRSLMAEACRSAGDALMEDGRQAEAEARFRQALVLEPTEPWPHYNLGVGLLKRKRTAEALTEFATARQLAMEDVEDNEWSFVRASLEMVWVLLDQQKTVQARAVMDELHEKSKYPLATVPRYRLVKARLFALRHDVAAARGEVRQILNEMHTDWFGRAYECLADIEAGEGDVRGELYFLCEALRYREGEAELERRVLATAQTWGKQQAAVGAYVRVMRNRRSPDGAETTVKALLKIVEDCPDFVFADGCIYTAAYCYYTHLKDYDRAAKLYERVAGEYPRSESLGKALWQAASCYREMGLPRHRQKALKRMLAELDPADDLRDRARWALRRDERAERRRNRRQER